MKEKDFSRWKIPLVSLLVASMLIPLIVFLALTDDSNDVTGVPPGDLAPNILGITLDGEAFDLSSYRGIGQVEGSWVVVNFFATWCAPCIVEHSEFQKFKNNSAYPSEVVSIIFNQPESKGRDFFEKYGGDWPVLAKETTQTVLNYRIISVPETYLIAPSGRVAYHWQGPVTADDITEIIDRIVAS